MSLRGKKVLLTYGPTWVAIDPVRVISNISSGEMGLLLETALIKAGAKVTSLQGPITRPKATTTRATVIPFIYFEELLSNLKKELKKPYHAVIHAAAVADYEVSGGRSTKIKSNHKQLAIKLKPTPKIIEGIKKINPDIFLVGFKLESNFGEANLKKKTLALRTRARCDLVVANTLTQNRYAAWLLNNSGKVLTSAPSKAQLATILIKELSARL